MGTLLIRKRAYHRKGYTRKPWTDRYGHRHEATSVSPADVGGSTFRTTDVGAPGRGKKLITIKGKLEGYHVSLPASSRHEVLNALVRKYSSAVVWRRLNAQVNLRARARPDEPERIRAREVFRADRDWVASKFGTKGLTPRAAIKKWMGMSPRARAKAMPGG